MRPRAVRGWALVAALAAVAIVAPQVPDWIPVTARQVDPHALRQKILDSAARPYQGYAEVTGSLKLPALPKAADLTSLLTTTTRVRSWYASPTRWRFDVLTGVGERDVYRTPEGELTWDYGSNLLTRLIGDPPVRMPRAGDMLPPDLARRILQAANNDPVSALPARRFAGQDVPGLRLTPADPATTIGHVDMWADPDTGLPLAVELTARDADRPVLVTRFVDVQQRTPAPGALEPKHGGGFSVATAPDVGAALGTLGRHPVPVELAGRRLRELDIGGVRGVGVYGQGLSAFVAMPVPHDIGHDAADAITKAAGKNDDLQWGDAFELSIPPLSVVVARSERPELRSHWYLLAGLTTTDVLLAAANELTRDLP